MTIHEMQNEIHRLKKENDVCILAHIYQGEEICEVADFVGDSFGLSVKASKTPQKKRFDVRCSFYGRNGKDSFAGQKGGFSTQRSRMSYGRANGQG